MTTEKKERPTRIPETNFEAMKWVALDSPEKSQIAQSVSLCLAAHWNPLNGEYAYPALSTIMKRTGIKSSQTVRKAVDELEALGEWAVIRNEHSSNFYFPMFVKNARTDLLPSVQAAKLARQEAYKQQLSAEQASDVQAVDADSATVPTTINPSVRGHDAASDRHIQSPEDQEILDTYRVYQDYKKNEHHFVCPEPVRGRIVDFVNPDEVHEFIEQGNPERIYVSAATDFFLPELAGKWMQDYGNQFGSSVTYTSIQKVYDELIGDEVEHRMDETTANVAMRLLGSKGRRPTAGFIRRFMFRPSEGLEQDQLELRYIVQATVKCALATLEYSRQNHYGNRDVPSSVMASPGRYNIPYPDTL
jgi:hypothetical protein